MTTIYSKHVTANCHKCPRICSKHATENCHIWPRICSKHVTKSSVTNDHGYVPSTLRKPVSRMTTDMFQVRYGRLCHIWPRICSKHVTQNCHIWPRICSKHVTENYPIWPRICSKHVTNNCVTNDHGYVPSTLRKTVSHMTTDMFQPRYGKLCHIWPRICSKHVTQTCVTNGHGYVPFFIFTVGFVLLNH
jgi:hypothetical protein